MSMARVVEEDINSTHCSLNLHNDLKISIFFIYFYKSKSVKFGMLCKILKKTQEKPNTEGISSDKIDTFYCFMRNIISF